MEFRGNQAIYLQIADSICEKILSKRWAAGDKIPSVREMAVNTEVNPNTVMRTFSLLQDKGIIYNQRGIGYFVAEDAYQNTRELMKAEFIQHELPHLFRMMDLLVMDFEDLRKLYVQQKS